MNSNRPCALASALAVLGLAVGCADSPTPPPVGPPRPPPPVSCIDYPSAGQDVVSCRYASQAQGNEVWARSSQLAAISAISLGATHIQWLSLETSVDTVHGSDPIECKGRGGSITCDGGPYDMAVGLISVTRFALLSAAEAAARSSDPAVPAERRPLDAHRLAAGSR